MINETQSLKKIAASVYICQVLTFVLAGFPLLIGVGINFYFKKEVAQTWLASHFEWQIKTAWLALAGFGVGGILLEMDILLGTAVLVSAIMLMIYRIVIGWNALDGNHPVDNRN